MAVNTKTVFFVSPEVAIEPFGETFLVFLADSLRVYQINSFSEFVLNRLDGNKIIEDIVEEALSYYEVDRDTVELDVIDILSFFDKENIIRPNLKILYSSESKMTNPRYIASPDAVLKEVDEDGAILYNLELEKLRAINTTGLAIWNLMKRPISKKSLLSHLNDIYEDVSSNELEEDVDVFIKTLQTEGFIGEVIE